MEIKRATKYALRLRLGLGGVTGAGKTYTGLRIGSEWAKREGGRLGVIDTEHGTASVYADEFDFDVIELESFAPDRYIEAIHAFERSPEHSAILIDSLSHAWIGKDGELEQVDLIASRSQSGNSFTAWRTVTPQHNKLVEALVGCKKHLIVTMRSKMAYELQDDGKGKKVPVKLGMAPMMRDGIEYEFDVYAEIANDHTLDVSKSRCRAIDGFRTNKAGEEFAGTLWEWAQGEAAPPKPEPFDQLGPFAQSDGSLDWSAFTTHLKAMNLNANDVALVIQPANGALRAGDVKGWLSFNPTKTLDDLVDAITEAKDAVQEEAQPSLPGATP